MIKSLIKKWLFSEERKRLNDLTNQAVLNLQRLREDSKTVNNLNIVDLTRENLKGFNPRLLDNEDDLPEVLGEVENQDEFLSKVKSLKDNPAFEIIANYLIRNQIMYSVKTATPLDEINFGRATINGVSLFKEEVARLSTVFEERHAKKPEFDEHEVV